MRNIFVILINFNSSKETHACLESLKKVKTSDPLHIVVVNNGSREKFVLTKEEEKENIHFIDTNKNLGFTGGNNVGIDYALAHNADYLMLLNNDTLVDENLLQELLDGFTDEKVGMVVPKIYFAKGHEYHKERYAKNELGKIIWYAGGSIDWANVFNVHRGLDEVDNGQYDNTLQITFATGCCVLIRAETLKKVGGFDERYFLYFEDADLSQRVLRAGYTIFYRPKALVWHITAASGGGSGSILHDYYITRNRLLFGYTYAPARTKFALFRESLRLLLTGRLWQKKAVQDFYTNNLGKGSFA